MWIVEYSGQSKTFDSKIRALLFAKQLRLQGYLTQVTQLKTAAFG